MKYITAILLLFVLAFMVPSQATKEFKGWLGIKLDNAACTMGLMDNFECKLHKAFNQHDDRDLNGEIDQLFKGIK